MVKLRIGMALAALAVWTAGGAVTVRAGGDDLTKICECRPRQGVPNALQKLRAGGVVRIAYLGGSITEARGWRPKTLKWFQDEFPQAKVEEVFAAISGTGSDYGAVRLPQDVLAKKPDLLFVEFRVNGSAGYDFQTAEGIVRQARAAAPELDVCFVYTLCNSMLKTLAAGRQTPFGVAMEKVCEHYGVPSIDFAPEILERMRDPSRFVFEPTKNALSAEAIQQDGRAKASAADPDKGKLVFAKDGVHPGDAGHDIYRDVVARSMKSLIFPASTAPGPKALPPQLCKSAWLAAEMVPAKSILTGPDWTAIADGRKDPVYGDTFGRTDRMLRGGMWTAKEGATFTVRWEGNTVGFSDIPQARAGEEPIVIEVSIDGGKPKVYKRARTAETRIYSRFVYLPELAWGPHTAVFTVRRVPAGQRCILGQFLVVGRWLGGTKPDYDANPVPAIGQNAADVKGEKQAGHPRVLILGNSITRHGPRPQIGWTNDFGMAATSIEKDFAHVLAAKVKAAFPTASFALANVAGTFERAFEKGVDTERNFGWMRDWQPDAVLLFFGANCPKTYDAKPTGAFGRELEKLRNFLANGDKTCFLVCEGFYNRPVLDAEKKAMAAKYGDVYAPMADIRARDDVRGRYNHPSDNGMRLIAERFWERLEPVLAGRASQGN